MSADLMSAANAELMSMGHANGGRPDGEDAAGFVERRCFRKTVS